VLELVSISLHPRVGSQRPVAERALQAKVRWCRLAIAPSADARRTQARKAEDVLRARDRAKLSAVAEDDERSPIGGTCIEETSAAHRRHRCTSNASLLSLRSASTGTFWLVQYEHLPSGIHSTAIMGCSLRVAS
jgi:hypothetical protein